MADFSRVTLTPAYGRDYKSKKEVVAALNSGADFSANSMFQQSGYCSVRDMDDGNITVRFKKLANVVILTVKDHKVS